jgi:copper chaperone CopZ
VSTAASLVAACLSMLGLMVVVVLSLTRPQRPKSSTSLHRISTTDQYPRRVFKNRSQGTTERTVMERALYTVPDMSCGHCKAAVTKEISALAGVESVVVDLDSKRVEVTGSELDDAAIRAAIEEAGYEAA